MWIVAGRLLVQFPETSACASRVTREPQGRDGMIGSGWFEIRRGPEVVVEMRFAAASRGN